MTAAADNCAVRAVCAITGEAPADIAAGIAAFPDAKGGPAFANGAVKLWCVGSYLESLGWQVLLSLDCPAIPWTCIVAIDNPGHCFAHCFAIVNGRLHDRAGVNYDGAEVIFVFVPPSADRGCGK